MSASNPSDLPFAEFIDDYFVECDEHLGIARSTLLALEPYIGRARPDRALIDELFRSFHSLKGLSAMVGVREAEQLAHQLESYLSAVRKGPTRLSAEGLEALIEGVKTLEQVIAARKTQTQPRDVHDLLARLAELLPGDGAAGGPVPEGRPVAGSAQFA